MNNERKSKFLLHMFWFVLFSIIDFFHIRSLIFVQIIYFTQLFFYVSSPWGIHTHIYIYKISCSTLHHYQFIKRCFPLHHCNVLLSYHYKIYFHSKAMAWAKLSWSQAVSGDFGLAWGFTKLELAWAKPKPRLSGQAGLSTALGRSEDTPGLPLQNTKHVQQFVAYLTYIHFN